MSYLKRSSEIDPQTGGPASFSISLFPDVRSSNSLFRVITINSTIKYPYLIDVINRKPKKTTNLDDTNYENHKSKNGALDDLTKHALENIYTRQWDLREMTCCGDKASLQIVPAKNNFHVIFTHNGNTAQVPAKAVNNTVTISFAPNEYDDMKNIPLFLKSRKYIYQLIPLCGDKDHLIIKGCSIREDGNACTYLMAFSKSEK